MNKIKNKIIILPILTALLSIAVMVSFNLYSSKKTNRDYNEFLKDLNAKKSIYSIHDRYPYYESKTKFKGNL